MSPARPSSEDPSSKILRQAREDLTEAEEVAEHKAGQMLEGYQRWSAVVRVVGGVMREQAAEQVGLAASGAAFWLVISVFPTAIAAVSLFGLVVSPESVAKDLGDLANAAPASLGSLVTDQLRRVAASDHAGLSVGVAVSLLLAVWSASAGVYNLDRAIRDAYGLPRQSYLEARGRALGGAIAVVLLLGTVALAISVVVANSPAAVVVIISAPAVLAGMTGSIAALYRFSVGDRVPARALFPGAVASAVGVVLVIGGFGAYVSLSTRYTAVYGASAGAVIGMVGTYLAVYVVLVGAVLNRQLASGTGGRG
jgi:membrane protein